MKPEDIRQLIMKKCPSYKESLWLMGERKWSLELHRQILEASKHNKKPVRTGIFLTEKINWDDFETEYASCTHLCFFNSKEQFCFLATNKQCDTYIFHHSDFEQKKQLEIANIFPRSRCDNENAKKSGNRCDKMRAGNFLFQYAQSLGAVHCLNKANKIQVVLDLGNKEWRLWHE